MGRPKKRARCTDSSTSVVSVAADAAPIKNLFAALDGSVLARIYSFFEAHLAAYLCRLTVPTSVYAKGSVVVFAAHNASQRPRGTFPDGTFCERLRPFSSLVALNLSSCVHFSDRDAVAVAAMAFAPFLRTIDLSRTSVGGAGVAALGAVCSRLSTLKLSRLQGVDDDSAVRIVQNNPGLVTLDLSVTSVGDETVRMTGMTCTTLRFLDLSWVNSGDASLSVVTRNLTSLRTLRVPHRSTTNAVDEIAQFLTGLTSLGLVAMHVTDDSLIRCGQLMTNLLSLHLAHAELVSDRGLEQFAEHHHNVRLLEIRTPGMLVSDRGLGHFIRRSPNLRTLKLRSSGRFTDLTLESIGFHLVTSLESLELVSLPSITYPTLSKLLDKANRVRVLHVEGCQNISSEQFKALKQTVSTRQMFANVMVGGTVFGLRR